MALSAPAGPDGLPLPADALLVPTIALRGASLFMVEGGVARRRDVKLGIRGVGHSQVLEGVGATDRIIAPFPDDLADGTKVSEKRG